MKIKGFAEGETQKVSKHFLPSQPFRHDPWIKYENEQHAPVVRIHLGWMERITREIPVAYQ